MVQMNSLPTHIRDFVVSSDNYTVDENDEVYDPYYKEYPSEEQIREQMEYQRGEDNATSCKNVSNPTF